MCDNLIIPEPTDDDFTNGKNHWAAHAAHCRSHDVEPDALMLAAEVTTILDKFGGLFASMPITDETRSLAATTASDTLIPFIKGMFASFDDTVVESTTIPDTLPESWL